MSTRATAAQPVLKNHDEVFDAFERTLVLPEGPLFLTDARGLWPMYLENLPADRQPHNCRCCKDFIERYGSLVCVDGNGNLHSALWNDLAVPEFYQMSVHLMGRAIRDARIVGAFVTDQRVLGTPNAGGWGHFHTPALEVWSNPLLNAEQRMAVIRENRNNVLTALEDYGPNLLDNAIRLLRAEQLDRGEKLLGPAEWLLKLYDVRRNTVRGANLIWKAVAQAPDGYCHPRGSSLGALLDDLRTFSLDVAKRRHQERMDPLVYQRPQALPSQGNVQRAEAVFEKLGLERSIRRRFATLQDVVPYAIWGGWPRKTTEPKTGLFADVKTKPATCEPRRAHRTLSRGEMTWRKFSEEVLPHASQIELRVPAFGAFVAMTAPVFEDAPPILSWEGGLAWYVYPSASSASQWGLHAGRWATVDAVVPFPSPKHLKEGVVLVINGAKDSVECGSALFPECLRPELREVRATVEAWSRSNHLEGRSEASACGIEITTGHRPVLDLRATVDGDWHMIRIDRWD